MLALVDCNSFFASCEKVFRPDLANAAVVVLSNNDGVVVARSPEAKKLGIPMGEAYFKIKRFAEHGAVKVFSSNFYLYADLSWRVMKTLEQWTPFVEIYSIDEAFLDFTGIPTDDLYSNRLEIPEAGYGSPIAQGVCARPKATAHTGCGIALGHRMISMVKQWTGIPVSVGFAPTKTLCKVANETAKSRGTGVCDLMDETARIAALKAFDVGEVWGVGRRLVPQFRRLGIRTAYDLSRVDPVWMRKNYSISQEMTVRELRGEVCYGTHETPEPKKSIQVSRSFGDATDRLEDLEEAVATFAAKAAEKARSQGSVASAIHVHVNTSRFRQGKEDYYSQGLMTGFAVPTSSSLEIIETALATLRKIYRPGKQYKKASVILLELKDAGVAGSQGFLFETDEHRDAERRESEQKLMETLDLINRRCGKGAIFFGAEGIEKDWRPRHDTVSPCYTTCLNELPKVK